MKVLGRILCSFGFVLLLVCELVGQQFVYENTSVLNVIKDVEEKTTYRFLYREALVADIKVSFSANEDALFDRFTEVLATKKLGIKVDENRLQALIFKSEEPSSENVIQISGYVLDSNTGERLPFATISWRMFGLIDGINTDKNGRFEATIKTGSPELSLLITYVGYTNEQIDLSFSNASEIQDLAVRLTPKPFSGKEIIVQGVNFYTPNDTVLNGLLKIGSFSPLGESNAVRSLQMLPSVSMSAAVNDGINIRGSSSDGFQVLLDGQTVYNQSHLFGLLDAMNSDVLKSSGFYYDVTPAQYQAPLGGTLSLITRTGSINDFNSSFGLSNTAVKSTIEGPIIKGKSSWLLSGRWSYLDEIDWFNNAKMIEYGLNVNRPVDLTVDPRLSTSCPLSSFRDSCVDPRLREFILNGLSLNDIDILNTDASFYDLHSKFYFETSSGTQFILSSYFGSDEASQDYLRDEIAFQSENTTANRWDNGTINGQIFTLLGDKFYSSTNIGFTTYSSSFRKDDFEFPEIRETNNGLRIDSVIIQPLNLSNEIRQFDVRQTISKKLQKGDLEFGISYSDFEVRYTEIGVSSNSFESRRTSQLVDLFQQFDFDATEKLQVSIGNRLHYFSNGEYLRLSPRLKASYQWNEDLSLSSGFSRNYQFMNRLQIYNINSNDFWILTNEDQPPSSVNYFTSGVYYNVHPQVYIQVEGYYKFFENLRLHELNTGSASVSFKNTSVPWFYQNKGRSRGVELLMKNRFKDLIISTGYTYSISELKNETRKQNSSDFIFNNGEYFYADWDRRHQISSVAEIDLKGGFTLFTSWIYGTGVPSRVDLADSRFSEERLPNYSRFDITLSFKTKINAGMLDASFAVYNTFDRENTWYSEISQVNFPTFGNRDRTGSLYTHVFDLGIQPSFNLKLSF